MAETTDDTGPKGERIAKRIARAGLCSRREAERWIVAGRVAVDGRVLDSPAFAVLPHHRVVVDGNPLPEREPAALWRYHKPAGLMTTNRDPQGRETIFDRLPPGLPRVMTVGRLDLTTEGLLLLTNDGDLARYLELPSTGWTRRYRVRVNGRPDEAALARLAGGVTVDGVRYGPVQARLDRQQGANAWLTMSIREGRNREIRKLCEHLGLTANRLIRTAYGPFQLGKLEAGAVEKVPPRVLRAQLAHWPDLADIGNAAGPARKAPPTSPESVSGRRRISLPGPLPNRTHVTTIAAGSVKTEHRQKQRRRRQRRCQRRNAADPPVCCASNRAGNRAHLPVPAAGKTADRQRMRIVGGSLRGRRLAAPPGDAVRPTSDRAREALFNRLVHGAFSGDGASSVADACVLDAFLRRRPSPSRPCPAARGRPIPRQRQRIGACVRRNIAAFGNGAAAIVGRADATRPRKPPPACTLAFFDRA